MTEPYSENVEEAAQIARVALPWISERQLPASPINYAVAYELLSGRNPSFCAQAQRCLADAPSQEVMDELFSKLLGGEMQDAVLASVRDELSRIFQEALTVLSSGGEGLTRYKQRLLYATERLSNRLDLGSVRAVISEMIAETRRMQAAGDEMQAQLEATCGNLEALRTEFDQDEHEVSSDPLTGVLNRRGLERELNGLLGAGDAAVAVLMLDIDHFTAFNGRYGHVIGDELLRFVARVITRNIRGNDVVARFGGDEFVVLLPATGAANGVHVARNIGTAVRSATLTHKSTATRLEPVTVSVGVGEYRTGDTAAALLQRAQQALRQAREQGRDRVAGADGIVAV